MNVCCFRCGKPISTEVDVNTFILRGTAECPDCTSAVESARKVREEDTLLNIYDRAEEAEEALLLWLPQIQDLLTESVSAAQQDALDAIKLIMRICEDALDGPDSLVRLRFERDEKEDA